MNRFNELFRAKGDQHTEYDNYNFTDELAPDVQRIGKVEVHGYRLTLAPRGGTAL